MIGNVHTLPESLSKEFWANTKYRDVSFFMTYHLCQLDCKWCATIPSITITSNEQKQRTTGIFGIEYTLYTLLHTSYVWYSARVDTALLYFLKCRNSILTARLWQFNRFITSYETYFHLFKMFKPFTYPTYITSSGDIWMCKIRKCLIFTEVVANFNLYCTVSLQFDETKNNAVC